MNETTGEQVKAAMIAAGIPPLPTPSVPNTRLHLSEAWTKGSYTAEQMRAYALAALAQTSEPTGGPAAGAIGAVGEPTDEQFIALATDNPGTGRDWLPVQRAAAVSRGRERYAAFLAAATVDAAAPQAEPPQPPQAVQPEPVSIAFISGVMLSKWDQMQAQGCRATRIQFEGMPGMYGTIDAWGKVLWGAAADEAVAQAVAALRELVAVKDLKGAMLTLRSDPYYVTEASHMENRYEQRKPAAWDAARAALAGLDQKGGTDAK